MKLYSNYFNSAGERVRIALALKGMDYEYVSVPRMGWDAYEKINPQRLMPTLEVDGTTIFQATAILEYLEEVHPEPSLLPHDPLTRAQARGFSQFVVSENHAIDVRRVREFLSDSLGVDEAGIARWQEHWFTTGFTVLEELLARRTVQWPYCFGETPGWADLHLIPQVRKAVTRFEADLSESPRIGGIYAHCIKHPAFIAAAPESQPDFPG